MIDEIGCLKCGEYFIEQKALCPNCRVVGEVPRGTRLLYCATEKRGPMMAKGKECRLCKHWRDDDSCYVSLGTVYDHDEACQLFAGNNEGQELETLKIRIEQAEHVAEQLQARHKELTGKKYIYFR